MPSKLQKRPLRIKRGGYEGLAAVVLYSSSLKPVADHEVVLVKDHFVHLSPRQQEILHLRFGLAEETNPIALEAIGNKWGITRERVRQLQDRALKKLRVVIEEKVTIKVEEINN